MGYQQSPPLSPDNPADVDTTFGFLTSFMVLPLLTVSEDRRDYSIKGSTIPETTTTSFRRYTAYSGIARYFVGLILCFMVTLGAQNEVQLDPFSVLLVCVFTIASVCSKMSAFLHKFTESHLLSTVLPCIISLVLLMTSSGLNGQVNTIANYVALFFAYQFLIIIPFGLLYLRAHQLTQEPEGEAINDSERSLITEPMQSDDK